MRPGARAWRARTAHLVLFGALAAACAGSPSATSPEPEASPEAVGTDTASGAAPTAEAAAAAPAQVALASTDLAVGRERFAFALLDASGLPIERAAAEVAFFDLADGDTSPETTRPATYFAARMPGAGIYVVRSELARPGTWGAEITAVLEDGRAILPQRVRFEVRAEPRGVAVGERPPPTANRTIAAGTDLAALTSDASPDPALYALTVDDAARTGRPTLVVFATPGYCTSRVCGPVVDEVKALRAELGGAVNAVHIEVYRAFDPLVVADEMGAWGLKTEPWVYVLDARGVVVDRLEGSVTAAELDPIVRPLIGAR